MTQLVRSDLTNEIYIAKFSSDGKRLLSKEAVPKNQFIDIIIGWTEYQLIDGQPPHVAIIRESDNQPILGITLLDESKLGD